MTILNNFCGRQKDLIKLKFKSNLLPIFPMSLWKYHQIPILLIHHLFTNGLNVSMYTLILFQQDDGLLLSTFSMLLIIDLYYVCVVSESMLRCRQISFIKGTCFIILSWLCMYSTWQFKHSCNLVVTVVTIKKGWWL